MSLDFSYRHLYYFWVVAREGGISRAAARLGMAVQTVSAQVRELERELGHALLRPAGRGVALTEAGEAAMHQADLIFQPTPNWQAMLSYAHNSIDIDFTVLLTHIGFEEDRHLARQLDPAWGVDLIIGGHSHTLPEHAVEENGVVIAQAGTGTDQIGRFDIIVDTDNNCIDSYTWRTVPICAETCPRNPAMEQVLHRFTSQVDEKYSHIVGRFRRELTHPQRTRETELGNLFADIFTRSLGIDIMLIGSGSIRAEKLGPIVTYGDLIEGFPYDDGVFMFKVTGQQLRQMLHYMLREEAYTGHTEFYQLPSTLRLRYDRRKGDFDYFTYCGKEVGKEIGDDALFTVGLQNYHFKNIESFFNISYDTICKLQKPRSVATSCQDILMEYFREHEMLDAVVDGRMTILPPAGQ